MEERLFDVGMPIGNLMSQVFANLYLNELDQYCKRTLRIHYYIRYMDDVVILGENKAILHKWRYEINEFLENELELSLNQKTCIRPTTCGVEFVGYRIWPWKVNLRKSTTLRIKRALRGVQEKYRAGELGLKECRDTLCAYLGMMDHCDNDDLTAKILEDFVLTHEPKLTGAYREVRQERA